MNRIVKSILSLLLCLSLCMSFVLPVWAAEGDAFSAELSETTLTAGTEQTVTLTVTAAEAQSLAAIGAQITWDSPLTLTSVKNTHEGIDFTDCVDLTTGKIVWPGNESLSMIDGVTNIAVLTFTVPANVAPGTYTLGLEDIILSNDEAQAILEGATSAELTIRAAETTDPDQPEDTDPPAAQGYTAALTTTKTAPYVNDTVELYISAKHNESTHYAAGELTIQYDSALLDFAESASTLNGAEFTDDEAGVLKLAHYGQDKTLGGNDTYILAFTALAQGESTVTLTSAAFIDYAGAETKDLIPATITDAVVTLTASHSVSLPENFQGDATVDYGSDYTFRADDPNNNYTFSATVNGAAAEVVDNKDGTYTVKNVQGNLSITLVSTTPKTFNVEFTGEYASHDGTTATYKTDYTFTLKDRQDPFTGDGIQYNLKSVTIGGQEFTGYSKDGLTYTIPGSSITGNIQITIEAEVLLSTHYAVTVNGDLTEIGSNYATSVLKNGSYTLSFKHIKGYHYTVIATMGSGEPQTIEGVLNEESGNYDYIISSVTGTLTLDVTRFEDLGQVTVERYLTIDSIEKDLYIILKTTDLEDTMMPTYDGNPMFWSDKYEAYCYLVFDTSADLDTYKQHIKLTDGSAPVLSYSSMDVNKSQRTDAADAQLVYNIYNSVYSDFTDTVTMEKFLLADVTGDVPGVDVNDAVAIISAILPTQSSAE